MILQPTRVVARKGIEHDIELVRRLHDPRAKLVISHPPGDEGNHYANLLRECIAEAQIDVRFIADRVGDARGTTADGRKVYTLFYGYPHTYPARRPAKRNSQHRGRELKFCLRSNIRGAYSFRHVTKCKYA